MSRQLLRNKVGLFKYPSESTLTYLNRIEKKTVTKTRDFMVKAKRNLRTLHEFTVQCLKKNILNNQHCIEKLSKTMLQQCILTADQNCNIRRHHQPWLTYQTHF